LGGGDEITRFPFRKRIEKEKKVEASTTKGT